MSIITKLLDLKFEKGKGNENLRALIRAPKINSHRISRLFRSVLRVNRSRKDITAVTIVAARGILLENKSISMIIKLLDLLVRSKEVAGKGVRRGKSNS